MMTNKYFTIGIGIIILLIILSLVKNIFIGIIAIAAIYFILKFLKAL